MITHYKTVTRLMGGYLHPNVTQILTEFQENRQMQSLMFLSLQWSGDLFAKSVSIALCHILLLLINQLFHLI